MTLGVIFESIVRFFITKLAMKPKVSYKHLKLSGVSDEASVFYEKAGGMASDRFGRNFLKCPNLLGFAVSTSVWPKNLG